MLTNYGTGVRAEGRRLKAKVYERIRKDKQKVSMVLAKTFKMNKGIIMKKLLLGLTLLASLASFANEQECLDTVPRTFEELNTFKPGDTVIYSTTFEDRIDTVLTVKGNKVYLLNNTGGYYGSRHLSKAICSYNGINIGDKVREHVGSSSEGIVKAITSDGKFLINTELYESEYVIKVD